jgi:hypothetical protein
MDGPRLPGHEIMLSRDFFPPMSLPLLRASVTGQKMSGRGGLHFRLAMHAEGAARHCLPAAFGNFFSTLLTIQGARAGGRYPASMAGYLRGEQQLQICLSYIDFIHIPPFLTGASLRRFVVD